MPLTLIGSFVDGLVREGVPFLSRLGVAFLVVTIGAFVAYLTQLILRTLLRSAGLDRVADRTGIGQFLGRIGYNNPASHFAGFVAFWVVLALFLLSGAEALRLPGASDLIPRFIAQIPRYALAALVLFFGLALARNAQRAIEGAAERSRLASARPLGLVGYYLIASLAIVVSLSGLGIDFAIVTAVVAVLLLSAGVGVAVTLAFGSRDVARETIDGIYLRRELRPGDRVRVGAVAGEVVRVGQVFVTLRNAEGTELVPHHLFFEGAVRRDPPPAASSEARGPAPRE
jgi:small-conductance mechanosensitive channel